MAEYIKEILMGGLVLVIALWLIPIQISIRKLRADLDDAFAEIAKMKGVPNDSDT